MAEGLKDKEDKEDESEEGGGTATIEAHTMATRSGEEISAALSALFDSSMAARSEWPSLLASVIAVYPSFKGRKEQQEKTG